MTSIELGGGPRSIRTVTVSPERIAGWVDRLSARHGAVSLEQLTDEPGFILYADDGAVVTVRPPVGVTVTTGGTYDPASLVAALADERVGLLVIRKGGFSVGVAHGAEIVVHRTGSRYVQGRTAAGGWSQQRFARRRGNQADAALAQAATAVAEVVLPHVSKLTRVVAGGDRAAVTTALTDGDVEPIRRLLSPAMLAVGPPKRASLDDLLAKARLINIEIVDLPIDKDGRP